MTPAATAVRRLVRLLLPAAFLAAGFPASARQTGDLGRNLPPPRPDAASRWTARCLPGRTVLTLPDPGTGQATRSALAALPPGTGDFRLVVSGNATARASASQAPRTLRGIRLLQVLVQDAAPGPVTVTVEHDGRWNAPGEKSAARLFSPTLHQGLGLSEDALGLKTEAGAAASAAGCYLVVHAPAFTAAVAPLLEWKARKGLEVRTVSTGVTGPSSAAIKAYLQEAYDTWENPPLYVLLVGDVGEIPTYSFSGNPSDLPYVLLDGDDWLPDAMVGRLPVENDTEARTVINKIVGYERHPYRADGDSWFTRSLMVGGVEGSDTPPHTVRFCGEQLQKIGFAPAQTFLHPPLPSNMLIASMFNPALDSGASIVAYRGWAYGTSGWSDPRYEVNDMGGLANGWKLPVVMSFVCLNGDYTASSPCFGEAFLRLGLPDQPRGAIAFIGNGEHWSHTRFNDGMAISVFEKIVEPEITELGGLLNAGKLRFWDFFPHEVDAETYGEESVEFYFHIYNLLGDPGLAFHKSAPLDLDVAFPATLPAGANSLDLTVTTLDGGLPVPGATVAATSGATLLGRARTGADGQATLVFPALADGAAFDLTVTGPGLAPAEGVVTAGQVAANIAVGAVSLSGGNGDATPNPGETLTLTPSLANTGSSPSGPFTAVCVVAEGPAALDGGALSFGSLGAGENATAGSWSLEVLPSARQGDVITCRVQADRAGGTGDASVFRLTVAGPELTPVSVAPSDGGQATSGGTFDLTLHLQAAGSVGTAGGTVELALVNPVGATLLTGSASFGPCEPGGTVATGPGLVLQLAADLATGTNLTFATVVTTQEGGAWSSSCALVVGPVDVTSVCGPDAHGYYAYDSADLDYPASRPVYRWDEISPNLGGTGTALAFPVDNEMVNVQVDLPFTFRYYGQDYSRIRVSDNGWLAFDLAPDFNFYNWPLPSEHGNNALVAPYWDNLVPSGDGGANGIAPDGIFYAHDALAGTFTVQWSRLHHFKPQILGLQTFQAVLLDPAVHPTASGDGEILFYYREVTNNDHLRNYATVGLESSDGRAGLQLSYAGLNDAGMAPLQPGLAVRLTTEPPVRVPFGLGAFTAEVGGSGLDLSWQPDDDRPVVGWHLDLVTRNGTHRLTDDPLPGSARRWTAPLDTDLDLDGARVRLTALHPYGASSRPGEVALAAGPLPRFALHRASPNPAAGAASIAFVLPEDAPARLRVFDTAGRLVRTLVDGVVPAGEGLRIWDGRDDRGGPAAGGVYFFRLESRGQTLTRKLVLVR